MDAQIDPQTRDLTGGRIASLANAVYLRLMVPLGTWWADSAVGSRLHELQREKDLSRVAKLAEQYARQALQPLRDDGRASNVDVAAERAGAGWLRLQVDVVDAGGQRQTFEHLVRVI